MNNLKPYELIKIKQLKINDVLYTNVDAYFIRLLKNDKVQVQINGTILIIPITNVVGY